MPAETDFGIHQSAKDNSILPVHEKLNQHLAS